MRARGFTLIELVVTLALVGVVALTALPLYEVTATRMKEMELRGALRTLRTALDAYKSAVDTGQINRTALESGYPPALDVLVNGVEAARDTTGGAARLVFLRQIPRDPFAPDPGLPPAQQWATRSYGSPPEDPQPGVDVFDVASTSSRVGSNGVPYREW
jgi:general secretion pathway protein G